MRTWQVRLAALLAGLGVVPGVLCLLLANKAFTRGHDMLLNVMPIVGGVALFGGVVLVTGSLSLVAGLLAGKPAARLQALIGGVCIALCGLFALVVVPVAGLLLVLYGGTLAWLMLTPAAGTDLGSFREAMAREPAPWGSRPGTGLWAPAPRHPDLHASIEAGPVQGPWAPDPRTLPWMSWKNHSGPRAPWWQTWQAGLAQGIPLWELIVLFLALFGFLIGVVAVPFAIGGSHLFSTLHLRDGKAAQLLLLIPVSIAVVAWLEHRMRTRLATRR
jgi:hypothetical protein